MNLPKQLSQHISAVYFGGNWTFSNLKDNLADVTWEQATTKVHSFNTIAVLVFHTDYFVAAILKVLRGGPLDAHDKYSFDLPTITSETEWQDLINQTLTNAEAMAALVEQLPETSLWENMADEKYGNYYRNIHGIIEHTHYHLGQIALLKKIINGA